METETPQHQPEPTLRIDILTLFPGMFTGPMTESILARAQAAGIIEIVVHDIRDWTCDKHHTADDRPYGGGPGMVMMAQPIVEAAEAILAREPARVLLTSPRGRLFDQVVAEELSRESRLLIIAGHYEGVDERVIPLLEAEEVSIGNYVLTGGELPAMVMTDAIARLVPDVITAASIASESHQDGLLEYPHYTRPAVYRDLAVPDVLLSGHHAEIEKWRAAQSRERSGLGASGESGSNQTAR